MSFLKLACGLCISVSTRRDELGRQPRSQSCKLRDDLDGAAGDTTRHREHSQELRRSVRVSTEEVVHKRCINMLARLFNAPELVTFAGTETVGSSEAVMLGLLAHKWT
jgi:hypothetical protein